MKSKISFFVSSVFSILLTISLIISLASAFDINLNLLVLSVSTVIFTAIFALLSTCVKQKAKFRICVGVTLIVFVFTLLFSMNTVLLQANYAVNKLLESYCNYINVPSSVDFSGISDLSGTFEYPKNATVVFVFIAFVLSTIITISLVRKQRTLPAAIAALVFLVPCFLMTDTIPSITALCCALSILFTLYITSFIRRNNPHQAGIVSGCVAIVLTVVIVIINVLNPIEGYERFEWQDTLLEYAESITGINNGESNADLKSEIASLKDNDNSIEDLSALEDFERTGIKIMTVKAETSGNLYLKGLAYADYENNEWSLLSSEEINNFPNSFEAFTLTQPIDNSNSKSLSISTFNKESLIYTPYYISELPSDTLALGDVCIKNKSELTDYSISYTPYSKLEEFAVSDSTAAREYKSFVHNTYTQLPDDTKEKLLEIAQENSLTELDTADIPQKVCSFVKSSAKYSYSPETMPKDEDFAVWFLNEANSGYCVHFATAATVMLRALDIPARYVTGFCVNAKSGELTTVTSNNAHAWVEYYDDEQGWIALEATPSAFIDNSTQSATAAAESTQSTAQTYAQSQPTTQSQPKQNSNSHKQFKFGIGSAIGLVCILLVLLILCIILRIKLIKSKREKHFTTGRTNTQAVHIYRYITQLVHYTSNIVPDEIADLATRAKFSNHVLTAEEVNSMRNFAAEERAELYKYSSRVRRIYYRIVKVL